VPLFVTELAGSLVARDGAAEAGLSAACLAAHGVAWVGGFEGLRGDRRIWLFEAADAESVRHALRALQAPFDRVWPATRLVRQKDPDTTTPPGTAETRPVAPRLAPAAASESITKSTVK
jgi:hypothetical protein